MKKNDAPKQPQIALNYLFRRWLEFAKWMYPYGNDSTWEQYCPDPDEVQPAPTKLWQSKRGVLVDWAPGSPVTYHNE